jgi:phospholipase/lecithinase/hemolysin
MMLEVYWNFSGSCCLLGISLAGAMEATLNAFQKLAQDGDSLTVSPPEKQQ